MGKVQEPLEKRAQEDDLLYERYGKPLESRHRGEFVAIGKDGRIILGKDDIEVLKRAIDLFGSGNFAFRRVGFKALGKWRQLDIRLT
jgi:hypothetical protein